MDIIVVVLMDFSNLTAIVAKKDYYPGDGILPLSDPFRIPTWSSDQIPHYTNVGQTTKDFHGGFIG